jgi:hypothetical protein
MAELADAADSKSAGTWYLGGSTPPPGTSLKTAKDAGLSNIASLQILSRLVRETGLVTPL